MAGLSNNQASDEVRCVWVLAAGPIGRDYAVPGWLPRPDRVVAADGGAALAARLGLKPDLLVGDLDSSEPALAPRFEAAGVLIRRYEHHVKVETDTELAVLAALDWRPGQVFLLGALGGRLDHALANVLLLTHPALASTDVRLVDGDQEVFLAKPGHWNILAGQRGDLVSLLPLGDDALGVRTTQLEYPLLGETLLEGRARGVSNLLLASEAAVRFDQGRLLVVIIHSGASKGGI